jgi:hypothetical protein
MNTKLKDLVDRIETWPEEMQQEAIDVLLAIEQGHGTEDRAALARSADDASQRRLVPEQQITEFFERHRRS